ncbi:MAG: aspartate aminotransferase family protein [Planctomycetota bacterium]|nr:aspartate aminotransferase family protein [Planctomycetota bacterium]
MPTITFDGEPKSNAARETIGTKEPVALRTFTPTLAVFAKSAGVFHWTPEGRRLYDYSSGVLVANLGHNPRGWMKRFAGYLGWYPELITDDAQTDGYFEGVTLTAYNAVTEIESQAVERLLANVQSYPGGNRLNAVMWAASGSEAVQKALWACLHRDESRDMIIATRFGFHGKKGLAGAVTGTEHDHDRDPRVRFISFPRQEIDDVSKYGESLDLAKYRAELDALWNEHGSRLNCLITEPYLGGGGSYHPPGEYLRMLHAFCAEHDILFILDEVQSNFGRTGCMYAFEKYGIEPDFVCLGKGLGNGVPVAAVVGRADIMSSLKYGEASDTWSANPISSAAVLATLDEFESTDVLENTKRLEAIFLKQLPTLKRSGIITKVRGEGLVYGIECGSVGDVRAEDVANDVVEACYRGEPNGGAIHLLGPLASTVIRVSPPMTMTENEAHDSLALFGRILDGLAARYAAQ